MDQRPLTGSPLATSLECTRELVQLMIWYVWQLHRSLGQPIGVLLDATIAIHFANAYVPESPFRDRRRDLVATLRALLREVAEDCPDAKWVHCGSWLNRYPPFLGLFPRSWSETFTAVNGYWNTQGWWGQYVTHRGTFHRANADRFRREGRHPYGCGNAWCSVGEAIANVDALQ
jgi:hypothetical protein